LLIKYGRNDSRFEDKFSAEATTHSSYVSLGVSSPSPKLIVFYSKLVSMGTCIEEMADSCNQEDISMPDPSFAIEFNN